MTLHNTSEFWHYVISNKLSWATRCQCSSSTCTTLQLAPPIAATSNSGERDQLCNVLRMAARCLLSIVFVGEGCCTMAQSPHMADALQSLGAAPHLRTVRFVDIPDFEQITPLLRALESSPVLMSMACPIEDYITPAVQRLLSRSQSLRNTTAVADDDTQFRHLHTAATFRNKQNVEILISKCDDATAQRLVVELATLSATHQPHWKEIVLVGASIERRTYAQLARECARFGNDSITFNRALKPIDRRACMAGMTGLSSIYDLVPDHGGGIDLAQFNVIRFENHHGGDAEQSLRNTISFLHRNGVNFANSAPVKQSPTPATAAVAATPPPPPSAPSAQPLDPPHVRRRVRGAVATHAQKGPAELAAEFASAAEPATPPPPTVERPVLLCANPICVNPVIDSSEIHAELVCTHGHETRVHKSCVPALALRKCDGGEHCPSKGCADGVVAEHTRVRIDEQGERHVKSAPSPPRASEKAPAAPAQQQPTGGAHKSKAAQRKEKKERQGAIVAAKLGPAVAATPLATPTAVVAAKPRQQPPAPAAPLDIDEARLVRLKNGEVECVCIGKKNAGPEKLLVKMKKSNKPARQWRSTVGSPKQQQPTIDSAPELIAADAAVPTDTATAAAAAATATSTSDNATTTTATATAAIQNDNVAATTAIAVTSDDNNAPDAAVTNGPAAVASPSERIRQARAILADANAQAMLLHGEPDAAAGVGGLEPFAVSRT
jgi:hypothetical protein